MKYKIWLHIEEIDEKNDHYEDMGEPEELACFDNLAEAEVYIDEILNNSKIVVDVRGGVAYCDDPRVRILDHDNDN